MGVVFEAMADFDYFFYLVLITVLTSKLWIQTKQNIVIPIFIQ